jgi:hypothetical protein
MKFQPTQQGEIVLTTSDPLVHTLLKYHAIIPSIGITESWKAGEFESHLNVQTFVFCKHVNNFGYGEKEEKQYRDLYGEK